MFPDLPSKKEAIILFFDIYLRAVKKISHKFVIFLSLENKSFALSFQWYTFWCIDIWKMFNLLLILVQKKTVVNLVRPLFWLMHILTGETEVSTPTNQNTILFRPGLLTWKSCTVALLRAQHGFFIGWFLIRGLRFDTINSTCLAVFNAIANPKLRSSIC